MSHVTDSNLRIGHVTTSLTFKMLSVFYPKSEYKVTTYLTPQS
jgi:hypothetical protein